MLCCTLSLLGGCAIQGERDGEYLTLFCIMGCLLHEAHGQTHIKSGINILLPQRRKDCEPPAPAS